MPSPRPGRRRSGRRGVAHRERGERRQGRGAVRLERDGAGGLNAEAAPGTPERYIDPAAFPGGVLADGVTITEEQGLNAREPVRNDLASVGLTTQDVISMRVFLDNAARHRGGRRRGLEPRLPPVLRQTRT
jgi:hypothetical protein